MRKILAILLLFITSLNGLAQVERPRNLPAFDYKTLHWGFTVGLNSMDFAMVRNAAANNYVYADVIGFQPAGFQVNIVSDLRLNDNLNLRVLPGINLGSRRMVYYDQNSLSEVKSMTIGSSFLDFPVILKYRSERVNNYRPYVIGGLSLRYDMSARKEYAPDQDDRILLKKANPYIEVGFGVDNYLQFFKFSTEVKLAIGIRNMLSDNAYPGEEQYAESLTSLRSYMLMLNFHFE